jgi:probable addiction module antidote protein
MDRLTQPIDMPAPQPTKPRRIGFMKGEIKVPDDFDTMMQDETIAMFEGKTAAVTVSDWNAVECIETKEDVLDFLEAAMEESDPELLIDTIGDVMQSKGLTELANALDIDRDELCRALALLCNPSFSAALHMLSRLGLHFRTAQAT